MCFITWIVVTLHRLTTTNKYSELQAQANAKLASNTTLFAINTQTSFKTPPDINNLFGSEIIILAAIIDSQHIGVEKGWKEHYYDRAKKSIKQKVKYYFKNLINIIHPKSVSRASDEVVPEGASLCSGGEEDGVKNHISYSSNSSNPSSSSSSSSSENNRTEGSVAISGSRSQHDKHDDDFDNDDEIEENVEQEDGEYNIEKKPLVMFQKTLVANDPLSTCRIIASSLDMITLASIGEGISKEIIHKPRHITCIVGETELLENIFMLIRLEVAKFSLLKTFSFLVPLAYVKSITR